MLNINGWELAVLALLFLLLFGPEKLPEVVVQIARMFGQVRRIADSATRDLRVEFEQAADEAKHLRDEATSIGGGLQRTMKNAAAAGQPARTGGGAKGAGKGEVEGAGAGDDEGKAAGEGAGEGAGKPAGAGDGDGKAAGEGAGAGEGEGEAESKAANKAAAAVEEAKPEDDAA